MTIHFAPLLKSRQAVTNIDDTIMQAQPADEMYSIIKNCHLLLRKAGQRSA